MPLSTAGQNKITASATGASDYIFLAEKDEGQDWTLFFYGSAWGDVDLQASPSPDISNSWGDVQMLIGGALTTVNRTSNGSVRVPGGCYYRLDVNSLSGGNPITLVAN